LIVTYLDVKIEKMQFRDTTHFVKNPMVRKFLRRPSIKPHPVLIDNLEIHVEKEEIVSLVGPSGVGKSTLLRILAGLEKRYEGHVALDGKIITGPSRRIQVVFQDNCLLPWLDVEGNIAFALRVDDSATCIRETKTWLNKVGLNDKAKAFPKTLSGGQASRAAFARAFIAPPEVLLLDEPFRAVDTIAKEGLQDLLIEFADKPNTTIVLVSHSIDDAVFLSDRVIALAGSPPTSTAPGSPLHILEEFPVTLNRPRQRDDKDVFDLAQRIKAVLRKSGCMVGLSE
jgi:ABC-type nitrate/sulfonate/bicarbonate transport system ATPase subunit